MTSVWGLMLLLLGPVVDALRPAARPARPGHAALPPAERTVRRERRDHRRGPAARAQRVRVPARAGAASPSPARTRADLLDLLVAPLPVARDRAAARCPRSPCSPSPCRTAWRCSTRGGCSSAPTGAASRPWGRRCSPPASRRSWSAVALVFPVITGRRRGVHRAALAGRVGAAGGWRSPRCWWCSPSSCPLWLALGGVLDGTEPGDVPGQLA